MNFMNLVQLLVDDAPLGDLGNFCEKTANLWYVVGSVIMVVRIAIPIIIILLGTIDLGKAVMAGDEKQVKEAQGIFIKRLIYGVAVFFVVLAVQAVFGFIGARSTANSKCFKCAAHSKDAVSECKDAYYGEDA